MKHCPKCNKRYVGEEEFCPIDGNTLQELNGDSSDLLVGVTLDNRYEILKRLGEGGMGVVYESRHIVLGKKYAIKVLRPDYSSNDELVSRFIQEAKSASAIGHENIINVSDFGTTPEGSVYFVMEYLEGVELASILEKSGNLPLQRGLLILKQIALALNAAHQEGIIHRDLKPENVFIVRRKDGSEFVKVLDFGIAKVTQGQGTDRLTKNGVVFGTPQYMSPEQASGQSVDYRSDIYSFGIMAFEILTGRLPFVGGTYMEIMTRHIVEDPPLPSSIIPSIPQNINYFIIKCLSKKTENRYQSMIEVVQAIDNIFTGEQPETKENKIKVTPHKSSTQKNNKKIYIGFSLAAFFLIAIIILAVVWMKVLKNTDNSKASLDVKQKSMDIIKNTPPIINDKVKIMDDNNKNINKTTIENEFREIIIKTVPEKVNVWRGNELIGVSPYTLKIPGNQDVSVELKLEIIGFRSKNIQINKETPEILNIELDKFERISDNDKKTKVTKQKIKRGNIEEEVRDPWAQ